MARFDGVELTDLVLTGPRVTLRPWRPDDAEPVFAALHDDPDAARFTTVPSPYTRADAEAFTGGVGNAGRADGTELGGPLVETVTGRIVGSADLRLPHGEIGYIVYRGRRGHGLATEAARLLAEWGLAHGLRRTAIRCDVRNLGSVRTALAAGFRFEGGVSWQYRLGRPVGRDVSLDLAGFARLAGDDGTPIPPRLPWPGEPLTDGRVALRPLHEDDVEGLLGTDDPETLRWSFTGIAHGPDEAARHCARAGLDWLVGGPAQWALVDVASERFAGYLTVRHAGPPGVGGIGYVVHPDFRGRRYTTRALRLITAWAFDVAGLARLELGAKADNIASQRAAAAAGFEPDGIRRSRLRNPDGTFGDEVRFALIGPAAGATP
jgi:RimJ/RimL family protein N-acetyltransferase